MAVVFAELAFDRLAFGWVIGDLVLALPLFFSLSLSLSLPIPPSASLLWVLFRRTFTLAVRGSDGGMDGWREEGGADRDRG